MKVFQTARLVTVLVFSLVLGFGSFMEPATAGSGQTDTQQFKEFETLVEGFTTGEQIEAWEAFLEKYPANKHRYSVKTLIQELKNPEPETAANGWGTFKTPTPTANNEEEGLDFLLAEPETTYQTPATSIPGSKSVATKDTEPNWPAPKGNEPDPFLDFVPEQEAPQASQATQPNINPFEEAPPQKSAYEVYKERKKLEKAQAKQRKLERKQQKELARQAKKAQKARLNEVKRQERASRKVELAMNSQRLSPATVASRGISSTGSMASFQPSRRFVRVEFNPFVGMALGDPYMRNTLIGADIGLHIGRLVAIEGEFATASSSETELLTSLRDPLVDATPEILSSYNFTLGGALAFNISSGYNELFLPGSSNDVFIRAGSGIINTDLELCFESTPGQSKCPSGPNFIEGANFAYFTIGAGDRFSINQNFGLRADVRYQTVFELIDGVMNPRSNFQLNLGASLMF